MNSRFFQSRVEKDFEFFVRSLPALDPVQFCGLAKILGVAMYKPLDLVEIDPKELKDYTDEQKEKLKAELILPMDEILGNMMDKYLLLPKRRQKEINQILKDIKRGK